MNFNRRKSNANYIYIRNTEPQHNEDYTSESREGMTSDTYTKVDDSQPAFINDILKVEGVKINFHVMDFISVDKNDANWETVLPKVEAVFE